MKKGNNIRYKAGVLLIAAVMVLSIIPAVTADTDKEFREISSMNEYFASDVLVIDSDPMINLEKSMARIPYSSNTFAGTVIFDQQPIPDDSTGHGPFSDAGSGGPYRCYENFWGLTEDITDVHWWGLWGFGAGSPTVGDEFEISFNVDAGGIPGAATDTFTGSLGTEITYVGTGVYYWGYQLYYMEMDLPAPVSMTDGWVSFYKTTVNAQIFACIDALTGDGVAYQAPLGPIAYDLAFELTGGNGGPEPGECIEDACDFEIVSINNVEGPINSLPAFINITIRNNGEIPIYELKLLADVYEKVCNACDDCDCYFPIDTDTYNPKYDTENENFTVSDDPLDDIDDLGDTWVLWKDEYHTPDLSYRCTAGYTRFPGAADTYVGRSEQTTDDDLHWAPENDCNDLSGAAGAKFSFWHKTKGEYMTDENGYVIPIDYGYLMFSLDCGATWETINIGDFVAYDNGWEEWSIYFTNTCNDGEYDLVCGDFVPSCDSGNKIEIDACFPEDACLEVKFMWHVNPCNEYEGWYIDDIAIEKFYGPELQLVHQTHDILSLPGCDPEVGAIAMYYEFPLSFDPEPDTWYFLQICGQVFSPSDCEINLTNNCAEVQFKVTDIHNIVCIDGCGDDVILRKKTTCCQEDEIGEFEFTFKNMGTFAEINVPVDLRVAKKIISFPLKDDFETDPSGRWNSYYFGGSSTVDLWDWSQGYNGIPDYRSAEDQPVGTESMICGFQDLRLELMQNMGNLLTNDEVYDICDKDVCCEDFELHFSAKWAMPYGREIGPFGYTGCGWAGEDRFYLLIHPTSGPDSAYWWGIGLGANAGTWTSDWIDFTITRDTYVGWFGYTDCDGTENCPPFEFGFGVFSNCDGNKVNPDATDVFGNPFPWGGAMIDNVFIEAHDCDGAGDVVYTGYLAAESDLDDDDLNCDPDEILEPGEEETITLLWEDTDYCNFCIIADVNLATDVNPADDTCCVQALVISDCSCGADDNMGISVDLTGGDGCLWGPCESDPYDDTFYTASQDFGDYRAYVENMDDSLISCSIDLSDYSDTGAILEFDTYFRFFSWCDPNYGTRYDDGTWNYECPQDAPTYKPLEDTGDFGEVYARSSDLDEWVCLYSPTDKDPQDGTGPIGCRLWWDDYYFCADPDQDVCVDGLPRVFDWATVQFMIPAEQCGEEAQIRFRMVSNDLNTDCIPYCDGPDVSEGWYIDDISIFGMLTEYLMQEDFSGGVMPPGWNDIVYSGTGTWQVRSDTYYKPPPPSVAPWAAADSDSDNTDVFDTELFSPSFDLSMGGQLDLLHTFEDFAGDGQATINTYSGGYGPGFFEETLIYMDVDGDDGVSGGGAPFSANIDASGYADPSDVYLGFWYTTDGGTYAWSYAIDNVEVGRIIPGPIVFEDDFEGTGCWTCEKSTAGDYWTYTDVIPADWLGLIDPDCDDQWDDVPCHPTDDSFYLLHGYPTYDVGLNNALDVPIYFDEEWCEAWFSAYHSALIEPGDAAYIEVSTDGGATWTLMWQFENYELAGFTYYWVCMEKRIDLTPYIDAGFDHILVRFRWTTAGNVDCCESEDSAWGGWAIDAFEIQCKPCVFTDETPPVTLAIYDEANCEISLFANDPGMHATGVAATYYKLDGGSQQTYTGPIDIADGTHTIEFWSVDNAGNEESHKSGTYVCDETPPTIEITEPIEGLYLFGSQILPSRILGSGALCIGPVTIKADASDTSGVTMVTFEINGDTGYDTVAPYEYRYRGRHFGAATVTATAFDAAGRSAEDSATFTIYSLGLM